MRCHPLWLFAVSALAGCSFSETGMLPDRGGHLEAQTRSIVVAVHPLRPGSVVASHDSIDLTSVLQSARSIPQRIESLEHTVIVCCIVLALVGIANAALLVRLLAAPVRAPRPVVPAAPDGVATCACGTPISARTKTGRCRACARDYRAQMLAAETPLRHQSSTQPPQTAGRGGVHVAVPGRTVSLRTPS